MTRTLPAAAVAILLVAGPVSASTIVAPYFELPSCDAHAITLSEELGNPVGAGGTFPADEAILSTALPALLSGCGPFPLASVDWLVTITNLTSTSWVDLFFVGDVGPTGLPFAFNNVDGTILGGLAFAIDTVGLNAPLIAESIAPDLIFSPGETWTFMVLDWDPAVNGGPPMLFGSIGVGAGSAALASNASIVANVLPEPATLLLLGTGLTLSWLAMRRQHAQKR